jgi:hypothetical protein
MHEPMHPLTHASIFMVRTDLDTQGSVVVLFGSAQEHTIYRVCRVFQSMHDGDQVCYLHMRRR